MADTTKAANLQISSILFKVSYSHYQQNRLPSHSKNKNKKRQTHKTISKQLKSFSTRVSNSFTTLLCLWSFRQSMFLSVRAQPHCSAMVHLRGRLAPWLSLVVMCFRGEMWHLTSTLQPCEHICTNTQRRST